MFRTGGIMEVEVRNFMTYTRLKERIAARVNVITRNDGAIKSTLVYTIAVGLGAESLVCAQNPL